MADFAALKAENDMLIELLKKNGISIPSKEGTPDASTAAISTEGFMSIPGDAADLEEAFEIMSDEPGEWKGLILPEGEFEIPDKVNGIYDWYCEGNTMTLPPGFCLMGAGADKTVLTGQFSHTNNGDSQPKYCKGVTGDAPVTYMNIHLELSKKDIVVGKYGGSELVFNNVTFSHKFMCNGIPDSFVRIVGTPENKGDKAISVKFNNCLFTKTDRAEAGEIKKHCVHLSGAGTYAELTDCVMEGKCIGRKGTGIYVEGEDNDDHPKASVDIKGAKTDIANFSKYGMEVEKGLVNIYLPRRPKVIHDCDGDDIYKDNDGTVKYLA